MYRPIYPDKYTLHVKSELSTVDVSWHLLCSLLVTHLTYQSSVLRERDAILASPPYRPFMWARRGPPRDDGYTDPWTVAHQQALAGRREERPLA